MKKVRCWLCDQVFKKEWGKCPSCGTGLEKPSLFTAEELKKIQPCKFQHIRFLESKRTSKGNYYFKCSIDTKNNYHGPSKLEFDLCQMDICPLYQTWQLSKKILSRIEKESANDYFEPSSTEQDLILNTGETINIQNGLSL